MRRALATRERLAALLVVLAVTVIAILALLYLLGTSAPP